MAKAPQTDEQKAAAAKAKADKAAAEAEVKAGRTHTVALVSSFPADVRHQGPVPGDFWVRGEERELELTDEQLEGYHNDQYFTIDGKATDAQKRLDGERSKPAKQLSVEESVAANEKAARDADAEARKAQDKGISAGAGLGGTQTEDQQRELNARLKDGAVDAPSTPGTLNDTASATDTKAGEDAPRGSDSVNEPPAGNDEPGTGDNADGDGTDGSEGSDKTEHGDDDGNVHPEVQTGTDGQEEAGEATEDEQDDRPVEERIKDLKKNNNRDALVAQAKEVGYEATDEDTKDTLAQKIVELKG